MRQINGGCNRSGSGIIVSRQWLLAVETICQGGNTGRSCTRLVRIGVNLWLPTRLKAQLKCTKQIHTPLPLLSKAKEVKRIRVNMSLSLALEDR